MFSHGTFEPLIAAANEVTEAGGCFVAAEELGAEVTLPAASNGANVGMAFILAGTFRPDIELGPPGHEPHKCGQ